MWLKLLGVIRREKTQISNDGEFQDQLTPHSKLIEWISKRLFGYNFTIVTQVGGKRLFNSKMMLILPENAPTDMTRQQIPHIIPIETLLC